MIAEGPPWQEVVRSSRLQARRGVRVPRPGMKCPRIVYTDLNKLICKI
jgi:hypothetical protein